MISIPRIILTAPIAGPLIALGWLLGLAWKPLQALTAAGLWMMGFGSKAA